MTEIDISDSCDSCDSCDSSVSSNSSDSSDSSDYRDKISRVSRKAALNTSLGCLCVNLFLLKMSHKFCVKKMVT